MSTSGEYTGMAELNDALGMLHESSMQKQYDDEDRSQIKTPKEREVRFMTDAEFSALSDEERAQWHRTEVPYTAIPQAVFDTLNPAQKVLLQVSGAEEVND